jgi:hypothetical protein
VQTFVAGIGQICGRRGSLVLGRLPRDRSVLFVPGALPPLRRSNNHDLASTNAFTPTAHWLLQALADADRADAVLTRLTDAQDLGWANVLARGGTFTWEQWNPEASERYSHGWGAQAALFAIGSGRTNFVPIKHG